MRGAPLHIKNYLRERKEWVAKNDLCRLDIRTSKGGLYGADLISRTLRSLEESHIVAVQYVKRHSFYRYIPDYIRHLYIPTSIRKNGMWINEKEKDRLIDRYSRYAS